MKFITTTKTSGFSRARRDILSICEAGATHLGVLLLSVCLAGTGAAATMQRASARAETEGGEFGPVVRSYLGYLRAQQEVVDDRVSRHEVSAAYYRRNSNRIRALRQMAVRIAHETDNDYLPELEAVAQDELRTLFEEPPQPGELRVGETLNQTFRYLGAVRSGREKFYLFARLDVYEQAELQKKDVAPSPSDERSTSMRPASDELESRPRRVHAP